MRYSFQIAANPGGRMFYADGFFISGVPCSAEIVPCAYAVQTEGTETMALAVCDGVGDTLNGKTAAAGVLKGLDQMWRAFTEGEKAGPLKELAFRLAAAAQTNLSRRRQSTLALATVRGEDYFALNVGDSPIFLVSEREAEELSCRDDLYTYKRLNQFHAEPEDRSILRFHLGSGALDVYAHQAEGRLRAGDCLLLCTDGMALNEPPRPEACADLAGLVAKGSRRTGDNATAVMLSVRNDSFP